MKIIAFLISFLVVLAYDSYSQTGAKDTPFNPDTVFVFKSPRKLLTANDKISGLSEAAGLDLYLSNSGFAAGVHYKYLLNISHSIGTKFFVSGARNTDEYEYYDYITGERFIPNKINRLFNMPLTIFYQYQPFASKGVINKNFSPFISAGAGFSMILKTPYDKDFFDSFSYATWYVKPAMSVGLGANVKTSAQGFIGVNFEYYYIPFGGKGLESVIDSPIKDFGGAFLSFTLGGLF